MAPRKKFYKKKKKVEINYEPKGDAVSLNTAIEKMGLHDKTVELLKSNNLAIAKDIAKRNVKQLYKIQGFGKKDLIGIERALTKLNLTLAPDEILENVQNKKPINPNVKQINKTDLKSNNPNQNIKPYNKNQNLDNSRNNVRNKNQNLDNSRNNVKNKKQNRKNNEYVRFEKNGKIGWKKGNTVIIPAEYQEVFQIKEDMVCVEFNDLFGYINLKNEIIVEPKYDLASSFSDGLAMVSVGETCGYINKSGEVVIPLKYEKATSFENGTAKVKFEGRWINIGKDGETTK